MIGQFIKRESCIKCRGCCRFAEEKSLWQPTLSVKEAFGLCKDASLKKAPTVYCPEEGNYLCIFLDPRTNKCRVYRRRPFECRLYPLLINRQGNRTFLAVHASCPAVEKNAESAQLKQFARSLAGVLDTPAFREFFRDNPHIPQVYPGALNLVELKLG